VLSCGLGDGGLDPNGDGIADTTVEIPATTPTATIVGIKTGASTTPKAAPAKTQIPPTAAPPVVFTMVRTTRSVPVLRGAIQLLALPTACMLPPKTADAPAVGNPKGAAHTPQATAATVDLDVQAASSGSLDCKYPFKIDPPTARPTWPAGDVNRVLPGVLW